MASKKTASDEVITMADVAQKARVSASTVSRIVNNKPDVSEKTRQHVLKVIDELGYTPHAQAQRLAGAKSRTIALIHTLTQSLSPHLSQLHLDFMLGATMACRESGYFFNVHTTPITERSLLNLYQSAHIDGAILMGKLPHDWRVDLLREYGHPFAIIGRSADNISLNYVDLDFEAIVRQAFDYLVRLGHQKIGFITMSHAYRKQGYLPAVEAWRGYEQALLWHGLDKHYQETEVDSYAHFEATLALLEEEPELTAIFTTQTISNEIVEALHRRGRRVPKDVSVMGVASKDFALRVSPPLTAIDFPAFEIAYKAAQILIEELTQTVTSDHQILITPPLMIRSSTGPASR